MAPTALRFLAAGLAVVALGLGSVVLQRHLLRRTEPWA